MAINKIALAGIGEKVLELWHTGYSGDKIAEYTGGAVTGRSILRYLQKAGINTGKTKKTVKCRHCDIVFDKVRSVFLRSRQHFCSKSCYWEHLHNPDYIRSVYGSRMARKAIRGCGYPVISGEIVHHKDGDCNNNEVNNLMVFKSQSDHMRWHRLGGVESGVVPLFSK